MRIMSVITAIVVAAALLVLVLERDRLLEFASMGATNEPDLTQAEQEPEPELEPEANLPEGTVRVMARHSVAKIVDSSVNLRGETEAMRQVIVRAETSGKIVSEPLRAGAAVSEGQLLCEIDAGTREARLKEAQAALAQAKASLPEAAARQIEAEAQLPASQAATNEAREAIPAAHAALSEAQARLPAAEAALKEAQTQVPVATAALAEAQTRIPEAQSRLSEAQARVREAEINLKAAEGLARDGFAAQTRLVGAEANFESAKAGVQSALAGVKAVQTGLESARSQVQGAQSRVENARAQLETARAGIQSAQSGIASAEARFAAAVARESSTKAAVQAAQTGIQSAEAAHQSARAAVAAAQRELNNLRIYAPFGGLLESDTAELGDLMQPGAVCATVIQLDPVKLLGYAAEMQISRITTGAAAIARLVEGRQVSGEVTFVSRSADPLTRTFRVEITLANPDLAIRDGQTVEIAIASDGTRAHFIAQSSLTLNDDGALGVRVIDDQSTARFMPVTLIRDTRDGIWVSGLPDEVDLITLGQEYVTDGVPVLAHFEELQP